MLRAYAAHAAMFTVLYRGYHIEVSPEPSGWRAGVYPRSADLPILCRNEVHACDQDEAVIPRPWIALMGCFGGDDREKLDEAARALFYSGIVGFPLLSSAGVVAVGLPPLSAVPPGA